MRSFVLCILFCYCLSTALAASILVYDGTTGTLADGWLNFSWAKVSLQSTDYVKTGDKYSASMVCEAWKGLYLSRPVPWDVTDYNIFSFWINGGDDGNEEMTVTITGKNNSQTLSVSDYMPNHVIPAKTWVQVTIPLDHFQLPSTEIKGFWFQASSNKGNGPTAYFEDIEFSFGTIPPVNGPNLTVDGTSNKVPINDGIYGVTIFWDNSTQALYEAFAQEIKLPLNRLGGDGTTRYNWQVDSSNSGDDWFFMGGNGGEQTPAGSFYDRNIALNNKVGTKTVVTIPMIQYINKEYAWHCSYPKSIYGPQQSYNPYIHPNNDQCGNGKDTSGKDILDKNPLATDIPNTPEIQKGFIAHLISNYGNSKKSGIIYQLDNEVSNWGYMHRDVHPEKVTYSEIVNQTIIYASAVKEADPTAWVAAPSEIQFAWYPDWDGEKNIAYFLQNIQQYDKLHNTRLVDSFDVHYPDANDNHWPKLNDVDRLRVIVDKYYPGISISFSEWSLAGTGGLNGALACADQLGHYARNGAAFASIWGLSTSDISGSLSYAFRIYRNYDGKGATFGDQYVTSTTSDDASVSIHTATRSDGAMTILVINKTSAIQKSTLALKGFNPKSTAEVYQYSAGNEKAIVRNPDINVSSSGFDYSYASFSLTMIILAKA